MSLKYSGLYSGFSIWFVSINNDVFLKVYFEDDAHQAYRIEKGDKLLLKFKNGNVVEVSSLWEVTAKNRDNDVPQNSNKLRKWDLTSIYYGNMEDLNTDNLITNVRLYKSNGYVDHNVSEKRAKKIQKSYQLLIERVRVENIIDEKSAEENTVKDSPNTENNKISLKVPINGFWGLLFGQSEEEVRDIIDSKSIQEIPLDSACISLDIGEYQHSISFRNPKMGDSKFDACLLTFLNNRLQSTAFGRDFENVEESEKFFLDLKQILDTKYGSSIESESKGKCLVWHDNNQRVVSLMSYVESNVEKIVLYYKDYGLKPDDENNIDYSKKAM